MHARCAHLRQAGGRELFHLVLVSITPGGQCTQVSSLWRISSSVVGRHMLHSPLCKVDNSHIIPLSSLVSLPCTLGLGHVSARRHRALTDCFDKRAINQNCVPTGKLKLGGDACGECVHVRSTVQDERPLELEDSFNRELDKKQDFCHIYPAVNIYSTNNN